MEFVKQLFLIKHTHTPNPKYGFSNLGYFMRTLTRVTNKPRPLYSFTCQSLSAGSLATTEK